MKIHLDKFDTSNFPSEHDLYSTDNYRVVGKFKSETAEVSPKQFVGLRSKMYSLLVTKENTTKTALKGIPKGYAKKHVCHKAYMETLLTKKCTTAKFLAFRSVNHKIETREITKICLSAFDDKRYLLNDGIHSLAYGHKDIPARSVDVPTFTQPKSLFDICFNTFVNLPDPLSKEVVEIVKRRLL
jgi:hypothetical protein